MILPFNMEQQLRSNWCWAAASKSVSVFYSPSSPWTQCRVASDELKFACCSTPFPAAECNQVWYLDRALARTQNYLTVSGPITWNEVLQQLQAGLVVGARIGWRGKSGHFVVIHGATKMGGTEYLHIDDPVYGKSPVPYNQFRDDYRKGGRWTNSYFTRKHVHFMRFKELRYNRKLLAPISAIRSHFNTLEGFAERRFSDTANDQYDFPHQAYLMRLDSLKEDRGLPESADSLRLLEQANDVPLALYEVTLQEDNPELVLMSTGYNYLQNVEKSIRLLLSIPAEKDTQAELRLLRIPALNAEAFWLHNDEAGGADLFAPVKIFEADDRFDWDKVYTEREFMELVKEYAAAINTDDDLLGG